MRAVQKSMTMILSGPPSTTVHPGGRVRCRWNRIFCPPSPHFRDSPRREEIVEYHHAGSRKVELTLFDDLYYYNRVENATALSPHGRGRSMLAPRSACPRAPLPVAQ